jgi:hypothetical protein
VIEGNTVGIKEGCLLGLNVGRMLGTADGNRDG